MAQSTLEIHRELFGFFHEHVVVARQDGGLPLTDDAAVYLTSLLVDRARQDRAPPAGDTLAELHLLHADASPARQVRAYRELGDRALHDLGLFRARVERTVVGPTYYEDMGAAAYARLDRVLKRWFADAFGDLFGELAHRFGDCVALLERVRDRLAGTDPLATLLERHGGPDHADVARLLIARGLVTGTEPATS